jgi:hypothetical protein
MPTRRVIFPLLVLAALAAAPAARAAGDGDGVIVTLFGNWSLADATETVRLAGDAGARHVTFLVWLEQDSPTASSVRWTGAAEGVSLDQAPIAPVLEAAIAEARRRGLSAGIDPIVVEPGHSRRMFFRPADRAAWFASYGARMGELAAFAARTGCDELIAGSELSLLFQDARRWREVIRTVRGAFGGHITISATWPDYATIRFWDALDSVGVSAYFPLASSERVRSVTSLAWVWQAHRLHLRAIARLWGKPITFVEVGYPATEVAATRPWDYDWPNRTLDLDLQARAFEAFRRVWGHDATLRRFAIWGGQPLAMDARGTGQKGFDPFGKPAESVVRQLFADRAR